VILSLQRSSTSSRQDKDFIDIQHEIESLDANKTKFGHCRRTCIEEEQAASTGASSLAEETAIRQDDNRDTTGHLNRLSDHDSGKARLAIAFSSLRKCERIGVHVLNDMIALYHKRSEVDFRPGLEPENALVKVKDTGNYLDGTGPVRLEAYLHWLQDYLDRVYGFTELCFYCDECSSGFKPRANLCHTLLKKNVPPVLGDQLSPIAWAELVFRAMQRILTPDHALTGDHVEGICRLSARVGV